MFPDMKVKVTLSNLDQNLLLEFCLLLQKRHIPRVEWRVGGGFGHLPKEFFIFYKSLVTSKRFEVELTVMSLLGYFRETLYFQRHQKKL